MSLANTHVSYGVVTRAFHWATALVILALLPLGLIAHELPFDTPEQLALKANLFTIHKTLGVTAFLVALARIAWALAQKKPAPLHADKPLEISLAEAVHWLLYGSIVLVPLTGWIEHAATEGFAPIWWPFGQSLPFVPKSPAVAAVASGLHAVLAYALAAALALHLAGVVKHVLIDRDATLARMWNGTVAAASGTATHGRLPHVAAVVILLAVSGLALMGAEAETDHPQAADLAEVVSDWQVQEGTLAITIHQFGSDVTGSFADWTAAITFDEDPTDGRHGSAEVTIAIGSLGLGLGSVTAQALGADFFDAGQHPTATFRADILPGRDGSYIADGSLLLRGVEVPMTMPFTLELDGDTARMWATTEIDRRDFHIGDSQTDEASLAFNVRIEIDLTAQRNG
ncbi:cytochrome b/b6 domain-containing protein [Aliiruegeria lutimaris]|uniref:Cytochrome b561 n=1 Tax=Aliiruegeria lutimaris TaxID=571298 RepID=A0A1G8KYG1_9RHOB|nr:cytochrome b/b6 domain-containing protein [Aliiruegeria lutimaris]SDI48508.1 Cytochrome b561 [Aliiruegeria lutimaris]